MDPGDDGIPSPAVEDRVIERDRKDLVGSERRIVAVVAVDDIVEIAPGLAPETVVE